MFALKLTIRPGSSSRPPAKVTYRMSFRRLNESIRSEASLPAFTKTNKNRPAFILSGASRLMPLPEIASSRFSAGTRSRSAHFAADAFRRIPNHSAESCRRIRLLSTRRLSHANCSVLPNSRRIRTYTKGGRGGTGPRTCGHQELRGITKSGVEGDF